MRQAGRLARFKPYDADPSKAYGLADDHPAVVEGRTMFPNTVVGTFESRRFLVSGKNSAKIGAVIEKGPWAGLPVFTLTLEERATCPRSCLVYNSCFGNAMQWARRNDASDPDFIPALKAEVVTLVRETCAPNPMKPNFKPPKGLVIRLHVLGDFYSVPYVRMWGELMKFLPELRVFGYTARSLSPADGDMTIASAIRDLNERYPDRWVIRWSADVPGPGRTIVVDEDPHLENVIVCPAQTKKSETCATCALCWSQPAWGKTIAFLRHGLTTSGSRGRKRTWSSAEMVQRVHAAFLSAASPDGLVMYTPVKALCEEAAVSMTWWPEILGALVEGRLVRIVRPGKGRGAPIYQVFEAAPEELPAAPLIPLPARAPRPITSGRDPLPTKAAEPVVRRGPNDPLMMRPPTKKRTGWGAPQIGTADQFEIGTAEERIEALPETEKERIARLYGATFKEKP